MIKHVRLVNIPVKDQQRALEFYTQQLGFETRADFPMGPDARWIEVAPPGAQTVLVLFAPPGPAQRGGGFTGIVFACDDVFATVQQLRDRGVEIVEEPREHPWGDWAQFRDLDGNVFGLVRPR